MFVVNIDSNVAGKPYARSPVSKTAASKNEPPATFKPARGVTSS